MANEYQQNDLMPLLVGGFKGLSLKLDYVVRDKSTFQQLDNFDLYLPGSLRKVLPAVKYGGTYGANVLNCIEYLAQPNYQDGTRRLIGVGADGKLYDLASATPATPYLDTSALLGTPPTIPFLLQYSGYYIPFNMRSWQASTVYAQYDSVLEYSPSDGNLYVFYASTGGTSGSVEPVWPNSGTKADNTVVWTNAGQPNSTRFLTNYLCIIVPGVYPIRVNEWAYVPGVTASQLTSGQMGVSPPAMPVQISGTVTTPNLNGYAPSSGRAYLWTLYNPHTLQESSPSPFVGQTKITETDNSNKLVTINGSILLPLAPLTTGENSYQIYYVAIPISAFTPAIGQGYTCIRVYATKDGGTSFFLVNTLFDNNGNQLTNGDGSIPIAALQALQIANSWTDYFPVPESQAAQASARVYEGSGPLNLAPDPINLGPTSWSANKITNNPMYVSSGTAPDGANSVEVDGNTSVAYLYKSIGVVVTPGTQYYFQGYIDNTSGTGGAVSWKIIKPSGTVDATFTQADGTAGTVSGTYTTGASEKNIVIAASISGTVTNTGAILWSDPVLQKGGSFDSSATTYPTTDANLTVPAPSVLSNYPPPIAAMAEVINDALHLVDYTDQTRIWYTNQGAFELMGANSYVRTTITKNADQILELVKCYDRLLVEKGRSVEQITTYPPTDPVPLDPQHGALARRAGITYGSSVLALLTHGLGQISLAATLLEDNLAVGVQASLFGDDIKPIIDSINPATLRATNNGPILPSPTVLNTLDLFLLAYSIGNSYADNVLMYYLGRSRGFSRLTALPNNSNIITLKEIQLPAGGTGGFAQAGNGNYFMLALTDDADSWVLFQGTQDGTITATAVTQPLPTINDIAPELFANDKHFDSLWVEGSDLGNFEIYAATNEQLDANGVPTSYPWGPFKIVNNAVSLGMSGQQLVLKFVHSAATSNTPRIDSFTLYFVPEGALT